MQGNRVGTNRTGSAPLGNFRFGIAATGSGAVIGGSGAGEGNHVAGTWDEGIRVNTGAVDTVIQGNLIGTNTAGDGKLSTDHDEAVYVMASTGTLIGGTGPGEGNLISGNNAGVRTQESPATMLGNLIGTDATGLSGIANTYGIQTSQAFGVGAAQQIGDGTAAGRNVISGNTGAGVYADQVVTLRGNYVGVGVDGTTPLGNGGFGGVRIASSNNTIGLTELA